MHDHPDRLNKRTPVDQVIKTIVSLALVVTPDNKVPAKFISLISI